MTIIRLLVCFMLFLLLFSCNKEDCLYKYALPGDRYVFKTGDSLLYKCSDGKADTFLVGEVFYNQVVEEYPEGIFSDRMCTYSSQECDISLQNLSGCWVTLFDFGFFAPPRPDSSRFFRIHLYGDFSGDEKRSCSWVESGSDNNLLSSFADTCLAGVEGNSLTTEAKEYSNVFTVERQSDDPDSGNEIHYKIHWNLSHGIIRFEDLAENPVRRWDLYGRIN